MSTTEDEDWRGPPHWQGLMRADGVQVLQGESGAYLARLPNGVAIILTCPCCSKRVISERAAKLVADHCYPKAFNQ